MGSPMKSLMFDRQFVALSREARNVVNTHKGTFRHTFAVNPLLIALTET